MTQPSAGNSHAVGAWEWWQYEIATRMLAFAREAAALGARDQFGVFDETMPPPEGGLLKRLGASAAAQGAFRLVRCRHPDWLAVEVLRYEESPGLWQFGESMSLADGEEAVGEEVARAGLFAHLDYLLQRAVCRLASEADGLYCRARVGWTVWAGVMTVGTKIDALIPAPGEPSNE